ncbi:MAG: TetR/AcrR family transcriptional regulator [Bacteroidetes bacterium]|nr:TetR/AcrR family transcriptional regulator [Bacteroidota bacterium]
MPEDKELKDRILAKAEEMFLQFGYSKVTMEEIASGLGMSKKTLYKYFPSKESLIRELLYNRRCEEEEQINSIWAEEGLDFVGKLKKMMDFIGRRSTKIRGPLFEDLQKNIPDIWNEIHDIKKMKGLEKATKLFNAGVETGIFRNDIERDIIILIYSNAVQGIINPETLSQLPISGNQAIEMIFKVLFEGILTEEGRAKYISYDRKENQSVPK